MTGEDLKLFGMSRGEASNSLYSEIDWNRIQNMGLFLTARGNQLIQKAHNNLEVVLDTESEGREFVKALLQVADNCTYDIQVQTYIFTKIEEMFGLNSNLNKPDNGISRDECRKSFAKLFSSPAGVIVEGPFLRALCNPSSMYLQKTAAGALSQVYIGLTEGDYNIINHNVDESLRGWVITKMREAEKDLTLLPVFLPAFVTLSTDMRARQQLVNCGCVKLTTMLLVEIGVTGNPQHIYELCFVLWTCSLQSESGATSHTVFKDDYEYEHELKKIFTAAPTISILVELFSVAPSRKVVRMVTAILHNLAKSEDDDLLVEIFSTNCQRLLEASLDQSSSKLARDEELEADAKGLHELLVANHTELSSFDRYTAELQSGNLRWGIVHTEQFWKDNHKFMEGNEWLLLKLLISYLEHENPAVVVVALYDLGEFCRFFQNGRIIVKSLGGKDLALALVQSDNPDVSAHALTCTSKIMVANWSSVQ